jgi:hypothetical protein
MAINQKEGLKEHIKAILSYSHHSFPGNLAERARDKFDQARNIQTQLGVE